MNIDILSHNATIYVMGAYRNYVPKPIAEVVMETKRCPKCQETKPIEEFNKDKTTKDGYYCWCRECHTNAVVKCKKEHREQYLEYQKKYRGEHSEYHKKYYERNRDQILKVNRKYQKEHPEQNRAKNAKYLKTEKGKASQAGKDFKRRSRLKTCLNDFTLLQWEQIKKDQNYTCLHCGKQEPAIKLTMDHIIPVSKGGHHTASNIQGLCLSCNSKKRTKIDSIGFKKILGGDKCK